MSAVTYRNVWGTWVGHCPEHRETIASSETTVKVWAECHNEDNHRPDLGVPEQEEVTG